MKDTHLPRTQNANFNPDTGHTVKMRDESCPLVRRADAHVLGLEDMRIYHSKNGTLCCIATTWEYTYKNRMFQATYDSDRGIYTDCRILESPFDRDCEKNWTPIEGTDDVIYSWCPLMRDRSLIFTLPSQRRGSLDTSAGLQSRFNLYSIRARSGRSYTWLSIARHASTFTCLFVSVGISRQKVLACRLSSAQRRLNTALDVYQIRPLRP